MKNLKQFVILAGTVLMFTWTTHADMANGAYSCDLSGTVPVWDISGEYSGDIGLGLGMDFSITEEPSGDFSGGGSFDYDDGYGDTLDGDVTVTGEVTGDAADPHVAMAMLISGTGTVVIDQYGDTDDVSFTASAKVKFDLDSADGELVVTSGDVAVKDKDLTTGKIKSRSVPLGNGAVLDLPVNSTGDWNLTLNLTPDKLKYTGTATVETSTGETENFTVTGTYATKKDTSDITLKGTNGNLVLTISTSGSSINVLSAKGKLFGQTLNYKAS